MSVTLNSCHNGKSFDDQVALGKICFDTLSQELPDLPLSDEFCGIFIDGRNREINSYEDFASFWSVNLYSKANYPKFAFVNNPNNFLNGDKDLINKLRIHIFQVKEMTSRFEYSDFCIKQLYKIIPPNIKYALTFQPDGFLCSKGWEDYFISLNVPYIGPHWRHNAAILFKNEFGQWCKTDAKRETVNIGNGGFSCRNINVMRFLSEKYSGFEMAEMGNPDFKPPLEDLFFSYGSYCILGLNPPTLSQCDKWAIDPITTSQYLNKESFGFHYPKKVSEWPKCNH